LSPGGNKEPEGAEDRTDLDAAPGELSGTVIRGAGFAGFGYVGAQILTLGFYLALARLATPDDFGQFAAASIVTNVGLLFTESGMLAALIHRKDHLEEAANTAVISTALGGVGFALAALAASPLIGLIFDSGEIGTLAAAMSGLLFVRSLQVVPEALLQRRFSFVRRILIEPVQVIAFGVAAVIATSDGLGAWGLVIGFYAAAITDVILSWALVRWRPRPRLASVSMWRELIAYGRHVLGANLVLRVGDEVPTVLIGRFIGEGSLGQYRYANRIASTPLALVLGAASYVVFPAFARISHQRERFTGAFLSSLRWFSALAMPLGMILLPLGLPMAVILFGDTWRDAGHATTALCVYAAAASLVSIASEALKAEGRPNVLVHVHLVSFGTASVAMVALLPFDLVGVAAGLSVGIAIGAVYALARLSRILEIEARTIFAQIWPAAVAATVMALALLPIDREVIQPDTYSTLPALVLLGVEGLIALAIYAAVLVVLAPDTVSRVRALVASARKRNKSSRTAREGAAGSPVS
jgi:O-antigen/teichoic acid export membrane protein